MAAILVAPLFIAYDSLTSMQAAVRNIQQQDLNATLLLARIRIAAEELRQAELQLAYATDSTALTRPTRVTAALTSVRAISDSLEHFGLCRILVRNLSPERTGVHAVQRPVHGTPASSS